MLIHLIKIMACKYLSNKHCLKNKKKQKSGIVTTSIIHLFLNMIMNHLYFWYLYTWTQTSHWAGAWH